MKMPTGVRQIATATALALAGIAGTALAAQEPPHSQIPPPPETDMGKWVVPAVRQWTPAAGTLAIKPSARIVVVGAEGAGAADHLRQALAAIGGPDLKIAAAPARAGDIVLEIADPNVPAASEEAYRITIGDRVTARARSDAGLFYAAQSLLQLLRHAPDTATLPRGGIADWPAYPMRQMMLDVGRKYYAVSQIEALMRTMAWMKMNTLHLHFTDWPAFRLRSDRYPGLAAPRSYDRADIERLERLAHRLHITIIPEIDLPAHASALIRYRPSLAFKCDSMRQSAWLSRSAGDRAKDLAWTIDITRDENRKWLDGLLDEFIPWFDGPYFHIGGDEYQYDADKTRCPELVAAAKARGLTTPGDVFVDWINQTDKLVRKHGKTTVIWNWWRFKDDKTTIEPDTDIVVETWNAPRLPDILAKGYRVIVSPEDKLYVVPGIANFDGRGYGVVDSKKVYENEPFVAGPRVLGYSVALWADASESWSDQRMLGESFEPMTVVAERTWLGAASSTFEDLLGRVNDTGAPPQQ